MLKYPLNTKKTSLRDYTVILLKIEIPFDKYFFCSKVLWSKVKFTVVYHSKFPLANAPPHFGEYDSKNVLASVTFQTTRLNVNSFPRPVWLNADQSRMTFLTFCVQRDLSTVIQLLVSEHEAWHSLNYKYLLWRICEWCSIIQWAGYPCAHLLTSVFWGWVCSNYCDQLSSFCHEFPNFSLPSVLSQLYVVRIYKTWYRSTKVRCFSLNIYALLLLIRKFLFGAIGVRCESHSFNYFKLLAGSLRHSRKEGVSCVLVVTLSW